MRITASALALFVLGSLTLPAAAQQVTLPLWPHASPEPAQTTEPEKDVTTPDMALISGHRSARLTNVTHPTLAVYQPHQNSNGAAALVFPGGGYVRLAWDGEGLDACRWLNSLGVTCLLVKYRVPEPDHYPTSAADLEDAQQAMRIARAHADDWHIDSNRIGVMGFSAGGHLAVLMSTHPDDAHVLSTPAAPDVDSKIDARPNFAILGYPAYLAIGPNKDQIDPTVVPNAFTPRTFIVQAENDRVAVDSTLTYYRALKDAKVPAELHLFPSGGHGFGLHPVSSPEEHWTQLAATWLRSIGIIPNVAPKADTVWPGTANPPCPIPSPGQPARPGRPDNSAAPTDPNCPSTN